MVERIYEDIKMELIKATMNDLELLKGIYKDIVQHMYEQGMDIWDDIYPCEFIKDDIENNQFYILKDDHILAGVALCQHNAGENEVEWINHNDHVLYIDRLGVNVHDLRKGIGSLLLEHIKTFAKRNGISSLRLFVVENNLPAIHLYQKNGFRQVEGIYNEVIDEDLILHEYGYECIL